MSLNNLLDRSTLRSQVYQATQQAFMQLQKWLPEGQKDQMIIPSILLGQLNLQAAIHRVPRAREALDDSISSAIIVDMRKIVAESIENEEIHPDGALKVSEMLKGCCYVEEAKIWELKYVLRTAGFDNDEAALNTLPRLVAWATQQAQQLSIEILNSSPNHSQNQRNQELDLRNDEIGPSGDAVEGGNKFRRKRKPTTPRAPNSKAQSTSETAAA